MSAALSTCPSRQELVALVMGTLSADGWQTVADHVQACAKCSAVLAALPAADDDLVGALRQFNGAPLVTLSAAEESAITVLAATGLPPPSSLPAGTCLRDYRVLAPIGRGGMGTVYRAVHTRLQRQVALKVLAPERMRSPEALTRFQREMRAVGNVNHPNVVQATDAGEVSGTHFLVMELVEGVDLGRLVSARGPLPIADACEATRQAALGLQHIHAHGLIHRDVKPSNLILAAGGAVKILDLGLALLYERAGQQDGTTASGVVMGSFDYMAPEQGDNPHTIDPRADLYSLGCTLYFLLVGAAPFAGPSTVTPLQKMKAHAEHAPQPVDGLRADVPRALGRLVERLLAKRPEQRFATAADLAQALQPLADGSDLPKLVAGALGPQAVAAPPPAPAPARTRPLRRAWLWAGAGVMILAALLGGGLLYLHDWHAATLPIDDARGVPPPPAIPADALRRDDIAAADLNRAGGGDPARAPTDLVGILTGHTGWVMSAAFSPDGTTLASGSRDRTVRIWDVRTGKLRHTLAGHADYVRQVAFSPDGTLVASASADRTIKLWDAESGADRKTLHGHAAFVTGLAFVPGKRQLVSIGHDGAVKLWDLDTDRILADLPGHTKAVGGVAVSGDGRWAASASDDGTVRLWDLTQRAKRRVMTDHQGPVSRVVFLADGRRLASGGEDGRILVWDMDGGPSRVLHGHKNWILALAVQPAGTRLASSSMDGTVRLWDLATMLPVPLDYLRQSQGVEAVAFSPDGGYLATGNPDGTIYILRLAKAPAAPP